jgi:hypothetical protein
MLRPAAILLLSIALASAGSESVERRLIGTWDIPVIDATTRVTYKPDHSCVMWSDGLGGVATVRARWRVDGRDIITSYQGREARDTIVKLTSTELQVRDGVRNQLFTYTRVK